MDITVNGKALEHAIGDHYWYISFGEDGWTPEVRESKGSIEKIEINKYGNVIYYAEDNFKMFDENMKKYALFWTKEEADKWFSENIPETLVFKPNEELFYVLEKPYEVIILNVRMLETDGLCIENGRFVYCAKQITERYGNGYSFTAEDLGTTLFRTYEEAVKRKKELE